MCAFHKNCLFRCKKIVDFFKLKEMMDIDESKCCPQAVRSELEFQEYLIQFIQQFCYLGLGRDHNFV